MLGTRHYDGLAIWCRAIRHGHGAGLTLIRVFEMQARNGPMPLREKAERIIRRLESGSSLEDSLLAEGPGLPELFVSLAAVGEKSGRIPEVFGQLEEYYRLQGQMRKEFRAQAAWPIFQFIAAVLVIALTIFLLGVLAPAGQEPNAPIGFGLTGTSGAIVFLAVVGTFVVGVVLAIKLATNTVAKQASFEAWLLRVPVVGPCMQAAAMGRFCMSLRLTLDSSMSTPKAVRLSLKATGNGAFGTSRSDCQTHKKAMNWAGHWQERDLSPEFIATITVGEESGLIPKLWRSRPVLSRRNGEADETLTQ
jgi:type IV pilus assembly protein PilC